MTYETDESAVIIKKFEQADEQFKMFVDQNRMVCEKLQELAFERDKRLQEAKVAVISERRSMGPIQYTPKRSREYDVDKLKKEVTPFTFKQVTKTSVDLKAFDAAAKKGLITMDTVKTVTVFDEKKPGASGPKPVSIKELL